MPKKSWIWMFLIALLGVVAILPRPVAADSPATGPQPQVMYNTPTALPDGRVVYIVQEGDTCLRIQLLTGTTIDTLRTLNKLDQACTISPKQELLLKVVTPAPTATTDISVTATPQLPTPTPEKGKGEICALLYADDNGNAVHDTTELSLAGGAVSISNRAGTVSETGSTTDSVDPVCMEVPGGEYNISMGIPSGYNGTTLLTQTLKVQAGETAILEFGAQPSSQVESKAAEALPTAGENNLMLAILGGIFVLLGIGLGAYILFTRGK